jgi:lipid-binding SYLF domain-containing protein
MIRHLRLLALLLAGLAFGSTAVADNYSDTVALFKKSGEAGRYFGASYGYAVFPNVGKGGVGIGGAFGRGKVYRGGKAVANVSLTQLSVGFQLGGQAYSEIIFFENKTTFDDFLSGNFEFGADASAVAITASASAGLNSAGGASAGVGATKDNAATAGAYHHGVAVFTIAKGGLMYQAAISGQKFTVSR